MKNAFYFTLKTLFVLRYLNFDCVEKRLDWKDKLHFAIYDVTTCVTTSCNTYIDQYLKK